MPEAMIFGGYWKVLSTGAKFALVMAIKPSSRTNSKHPKRDRGVGTFCERALPHGAKIV